MFLIIAGLVAAMQGQPSAQADAVVLPEWDLTQRQRSRDLIASTSFSNGVTIVARCDRGTYLASIHGLPADTGENGMRQIRIGIGRPGAYFTRWVASEGGNAVFSRTPARFARQLREGGELNVTVQGGDGRPNQRFVMDLPASPQAIDQTLDLCEQPRIDPRDAMLEADLASPNPVGRGWVRRPQPYYPEVAIRNGAARGAVTITCLALADGSLDRCETDSEFPQNMDFGREALRAASRARLNPSPGASPRMVSFPIDFRMQ